MNVTYKVCAFLSSDIFDDNNYFYNCHWMFDGFYNSRTAISKRLNTRDFTVGGLYNNYGDEAMVYDTFD